MKTQFILLVLFGSMFSFTALAAQENYACNATPTNKKTVYGEDDRKEVYEVAKSVQRVTESTVIMVNWNQLERLKNNQGYRLTTNKLGELANFCKGMRYYDQPTSLHGCSGFMVGEDLIATAGHCIEGEPGDDCQDYAFLFGYQMKANQQARLTFPDKDVYRCQNIVAGEFLKEQKRDWRLLRMMHKIVERRPLAIRRTGKINAVAGVTVIGHPMGLPVKISTGNVTNNKHSYAFITDLDTFRGNSGSAVINSRSILEGEPIVEGIFVRGGHDLSNMQNFFQCERYIRCQNTGTPGCEGEQVTRISVLRNAIPKIATPQPPQRSKKTTHWIENTLAIRLNQKQYQLGESITIHITLPQSGYLTVIHSDSAGTHTMLYPNQWEPTRFLPAQQLILPSKHSGYQLRALRPAGKFSITAVLSEYPITPPCATEQGFASMDKKMFLRVSKQPRQWLKYGRIDVVIVI